MKNYVVWHNCKINDTQHRFNIEPSAGDHITAAYDRMWQISHASAGKFLAGDWEVLVFREPAETRVKMFQHSWQRIWDLWHLEPCNILYLDSDAMFIRPTEIFDRFTEFRMFNWSDPKTTELFENNYNAGVRYYPSTMGQELWALGADMARHWDLDIWDQEQRIFNAMFWSQNVPDPHHPELNWQGMHLKTAHPDIQRWHEEWNQCTVDRVQILHVHGSRGAVATAAVMENIAQQVGLLI